MDQKEAHHEQKKKITAGYFQIKHSNDSELDGFIFISIGDSLLFGRHPSCTQTFSHDAISGFHCKVYVIQFDPSSSPMVYCQDTSLNGTFLNGILIGRQHTALLSHGDCISLSNVYQIFYIENPIFKSENSSLVKATKKEVGKYLVSNRVIGKGAFGEVLLAFTKTGEHIACKVSKSISTNSFQPSVEASILKNLSHPNIITVRNTIFSDQKVFIFEDLLSGGDLFSYLIGPNETLRALPEAEVLFICYQILHALRYLHSMHIAHRDLKLDNILLESPFPGSRVVLGDFGIAKSLSESRSKMSTIIGTPEYSAPEVGFNKSKGFKGYNLMCDMWSLGVIIHILFTGISPFFDENNVKQTAINASNGKIFLETEDWNRVSSKGKDFVRKLLQVNPDKRMSSDICFQHKWITRFAPRLDEIYNERIVQNWSSVQK